MQHVKSAITRTVKYHTKKAKDNPSLTTNGKQTLAGVQDHDFLSTHAFIHVHPHSFLLFCSMCSLPHTLHGRGWRGKAQDAVITAVNPHPSNQWLAC